MKDSQEIYNKVEDFNLVTLGFQTISKHVDPDKKILYKDAKVLCCKMFHMDIRTSRKLLLKMRDDGLVKIGHKFLYLKDDEHD